MIFQHDDDGFRDWQEANEEKGLYINCTGRAANHTLHKAKCKHLPKTNSDKRGKLSVTSTSKEVFVDNAAWRKRQKELVEQPHICKTCFSATEA